MTRIVAIGLFLACLFASGGAPAKQEFPLRDEYPDVKIMTTEQLWKQYRSVIKIDVRSGFEYGTVRMTEAHHVSLSSDRFAFRVKKLQQTGQTVAFYCNGHTCAKSYKAAKKAMEAGIENVFAYDAGIFDWIQAHPDRGYLFNTTPVDLAEIIPKSKLLEHVIPLADFRMKARQQRAIVIDVRDLFQIEGREVPFEAVHEHMDKLVLLLALGKYKGKTMLIVDAVGKQVRWLQYYLEANDYRNYYFLKDGALSFSAG